MTLKATYGREIINQLYGNSSGGHFCSQHANSVPFACSLKTSVALCSVTKLHILEWTFLSPAQGVMIMLFNQLLDMPHLSGGWIYLGKSEMLTNRDKNTFVHQIREISFLCIWTLLGYFISVHETLDQHFTCCVYIFVQYRIHFKDKKDLS